MCERVKQCVLLGQTRISGIVDMLVVLDVFQQIWAFFSRLFVTCSSALFDIFHMLRATYCLTDDCGMLYVKSFPECSTRLESI